jgi:hypothetical protein
LVVAALEEITSEETRSQQMVATLHLMELRLLVEVLEVSTGLPMEMQEDPVEVELVAPEVPEQPIKVETEEVDPGIGAAAVAPQEVLEQSVPEMEHRVFRARFVARQGQ